MVTKNNRRLRGNALIELVICLFPYGMLLLGIILLGTLALGKVEGRQAVIWATPRPGEQSESNVRDHFFGHLADADDPNADLEFSDDTSYSPDVGTTSEEPVLPYTGTDMLTAMTRMGYDVVTRTTVNRDGSVTSETSVSENLVWQYLEARGITDDQCTDSIAAVLGNWLNYSRSWTEYAYRLPTSGTFANETADAEAEEFRDWFRMGGEDAEGYDAQGVSRNESDNRGRHLSEPTIDFDLMNAELAIIPDTYEDPDTDMDDTTKELWDKNNGF